MCERRRQGRPIVGCMNESKKVNIKHTCVKRSRKKLKNVKTW